MKQAIGPIGIGIGCPGNMLMGAWGGSLISALTYVAPSKVRQYVRADPAYVTRDGSNRVSQWNDISGAAKHYTQGTAGNKPLYSATGGPNSTPIVSLDDVARYMSSTLTTNTPSTTQHAIWFVARQVSWANGRRIISDTTNLKRLTYQEGVTPQVDLYDGASVGNNAGGTVGSFARFYAHWAMGSSRLWIGASDSGATLNPSAQAADVGRLIGNNAGSSAVVDFCEVLYVEPSLSAQELSDLATIYIPSRYGVGNVLV